jgi:hypothetical protein
MRSNEGSGNREIVANEQNGYKIRERGHSW